MVATTLDAAAGLTQRQKWGLILPSSARVSLLTYQTVLGVRYPELVKATADGWRSTEATLQGDSYRFFGMSQKAPCTLSAILEH